MKSLTTEFLRVNTEFHRVDILISENLRDHGKQTDIIKYFPQITLINADQVRIFFKYQDS